MTTTEERLRDYLSAVADSVRPGNTRPLASPQSHKRQRRAKAVFWHRGWPAWVAPFAAAASVLAVVAVAVAVADLATVHRSTALPGAGTTTAPRQYYAEVDGSDTGGSVVIMSTSSGAVIARVPASALLRESGLPAQQGVLDAVAAAPDDRTFYAEVLTADTRLRIFKFRVNGTGLVSGITRIPGGVVSGGYDSGIPSLAVSPDGGSLALTATSSAAMAGISGHGDVMAVQDEIVVIDLRSGTQRTWHGGLYSTGTSFDIQDLSWADQGRALVFVPAWCPRLAASWSLCPYSVGSNDHSQVRLLSVGGASGGSLAGSHVLLGAADVVQRAVSDQDGNLDVLNLSGPKSKQGRSMTVTVEQFSATSGALRGVLYRRAYHGDSYRNHLIGTYLSADPSGRYLLLGLEFDVSTVRNEVGWIDNGSLRALKVGKDDAELLPDAW